MFYLVPKLCKMYYLNSTIKSIKASPGPLSRPVLSRALCLVHHPMLPFLLQNHCSLCAAINYSIQSLLLTSWHPVSQCKCWAKLADLNIFGNKAPVAASVTSLQIKWLRVRRGRDPKAELCVRRRDGSLKKNRDQQARLWTLHSLGRAGQSRAGQGKAILICLLPWSSAKSTDSVLCATRGAWGMNREKQLESSRKLGQLFLIIGLTLWLNSLWSPPLHSGPTGTWVKNNNPPPLSSPKYPAPEESKGSG